MQSQLYTSALYHSHDLIASETCMKNLASVSSWVQGVKPEVFLSWVQSVLYPCGVWWISKIAEIKDKEVIAVINGWVSRLFFTWLKNAILCAMRLLMMFMIWLLLWFLHRCHNSLIRQAISSPGHHHTAKGSVWDLQHGHHPSHKNFSLWAWSKSMLENSYISPATFDPRYICVISHNYL